MTLVTTCCCSCWPTNWQKTTECRTAKRWPVIRHETLRHAQKLPNQVYGGGRDHHPRRDDETLLDPVHDYARPDGNIDPVLGRRPQHFEAGQLNGLMTGTPPHRHPASR